MLSQLGTDQTDEDGNKRAEKNKKDTIHFWKGIQGIYTIVITNKVFDFQRMKLTHTAEKTMEPLLVNPYELRHTEQLDRSYGDVPNRIILLMLGHLNKSVAELETPIEEWAYVLNDQTLRSGVVIIPVTKELTDIELITNRNPGIREFIERIDVKNLPYEVRDRLRAIYYLNTTIIDIEEKGFERGKKEWKEEREKEWRKEVAYTVKKMGKLTDAEIAAASDLTEADVAAMKID